MCFDTKKCYILSTCRKPSHYCSLNSHKLQQVDCSLYLGVTITHDLKWMTYINIMRTAQKSSVLYSNCRKAAYISVACSGLEYSAVVWDPY